MDNEVIASKLFDLANELAGDETGHLAAIIHSVVSELWHPAEVNAFEMVDKARSQLNLIAALKGGKVR